MNEIILSFCVVLCVLPIFSFVARGYQSLASLNLARKLNFIDGAYCHDYSFCCIVIRYV